MHRLLLIRHGEAAAAWGAAGDDPGLSARGLTQAEGAAAALARERGLGLISSPMRRCRETAAPLERALGLTARIEPGVSEVATPESVEDRRAWLAETFPWRPSAPHRLWRDQAPFLRAWREDVLATVRGFRGDAAVFTHFIAINAIVGAALGRAETIVCRPDNASITELAIEGDALRLVRLGAQMDEGEVR